MTYDLTPAQHAILAHAHQYTEGKITWFPDHIKGGARKRVLDGLFSRALITPLKEDWFITAEGYEVLGVPHQAPVTLQALDEAIKAAAGAEEEPRRRDNSKQAQVMAMLKCPEGATIAQIMEITGWQAHTVRGTFAGVFKKKLGLTITSEKSNDGIRIYRLEK